MKNILLTLTILVFGIGVGVYVGKKENLPNSQTMTSQDKNISSADDNKSPLYWIAPMDPNYRSDKPGKSPMGMDLIPVYGEDLEVAESVIKISPSVVNNLGVRTTPVIRGQLARKVSTVGYLDYDETRISHIHARTDGWIERLWVRSEGERVDNNQLLFELYAPTLVNAQEEYLQALTSTNKVLLDASRERLIALGVSKSQVDLLDKEKKVSQYVKYYSPQSGVLSRLNVREGMYIKPDTEVISLANLDQVWLLAEVFERQATWVKSGQTAEARLPSSPERVWTGVVEFIYPDLDPVTRTLRVRMRFENPERLLMPNMYAHVDISGEPKREVLSIPREAIIYGSKMTRVIVALGDGRFEAREIIIGIESDSSIEIVRGLSEGEVVVTSAQFLIDSEASLKASIHRLDPLPDQDNVMLTDGEAE